MGPYCILNGCLICAALLILGWLCAHLVFSGYLGYVVGLRAPT